MMHIYGRLIYLQNMSSCSYYNRDFWNFRPQIWCLVMVLTNLLPFKFHRYWQNSNNPITLFTLTKFDRVCFFITKQCSEKKELLHISPLLDYNVKMSAFKSCTIGEIFNSKRYQENLWNKSLIPEILHPHQASLCEFKRLFLLLLLFCFALI